jgi:hypothetical protein
VGRRGGGGGGPRGVVIEVGVRATLYGMRIVSHGMELLAGTPALRFSSP